MPQMSPMMWIQLMIYFLMSYFFIMMMIYNIMIYKNLNTKFMKNINFIKFNFKW